VDARRVKALLAATALLALAACGSEAPGNEPAAEETEVPEELRAEALPRWAC
jgi:predicted small lipoprotein YifL